MYSISEKWELMLCSEQPDLVVIHSSTHSGKKSLKERIKRRREYGFNCFILWTTGEVIDCNFSGIDYSISYQTDTKKNYYNPFLGACNSKGLEKCIAESTKNYSSTDKRNFCNFIYRHKGRNAKYIGAIKRIEFCKLLSKYKRVDCAGPCLNNTSKLKDFEKK